MSFYKRYELRRLLADGEVKTFSAVENETGRDVLLHMFNPPGLPLLAEFKTRFLRADGSASLPAIEIGEFAGSQYAVTQPVDSFQSLRQWMREQPEVLGAGRALPAAAPPRPTPPPAAVAPARPLPPEQEPGDFTQLFGPDPKLPASKPAAPVAPPPLVADDPGDFTRAFGSPAPMAPPVRATSPAAPPPLLADDPGDFTRAFGPPVSKAAPQRAAAPVPKPAEDDEFLRNFGGGDAQSTASIRTAPTQQILRPAAQAQPTWPPPPPVSAAPSPAPRAASPLPAMPERSAEDTGEFTKLFGSGPAGQSIDIAEEQAKAARTASKEARPFQQAGEFTRMFGPEVGGNQTAGPADVTFALNTSASSLFGSPEELARNADAALAASASPEATSEYSKIFGGPSSAEAPPPVPKAAPASVAVRRQGISPLAIVLITLGAAIVVAGLIYLAVYLGNR